MAKIQRANVILRVDEKDVDHYLKLGYNLIEEDGTIIKQAVPHDLNSLQTAYVESRQRIEELEQTIAKLTAENNKLKSAAKKTAK